jgi:hypothetical protein
MAGIFIVLDHMNWLEQQGPKYRLNHDGGKLLKFLMQRLSIGSNHWTFGYCFEGQKKSLPTKKKERQAMLGKHLTTLHERMVLAKKELGQMQIIGVGRLACECLTGSSELKKRSGTSWMPLQRWRDLSDQVWICYSTDAALFDAGLAVEISGVISAAARKAGVETKIKTDLPMFDWSEYEK